MAETAEVYRSSARSGAAGRVYVPRRRKCTTRSRRAAPAPPSGGSHARREVLRRRRARLARRAPSRSRLRRRPGQRGLWVTEPAISSASVDAAAPTAGRSRPTRSATRQPARARRLRRRRSRHPASTACASSTPRSSRPTTSAHRRSGAIASMQPTHATSDMPWAEARIGSERIRRLRVAHDARRRHPARRRHRLPRRGGERSGRPARRRRARRLAGDYSSAAHARRGATRVHRRERLCHRRRGVAGRAAVGQAADLTVFDRGAADLIDARPTLTIVGGRIAHHLRQQVAADRGRRVAHRPHRFDQRPW